MTLRCVLFGHRYGRRERRKLHGVHVLGLCCERCAWWCPAVPRTAHEHRQMAKAGRVVLEKARRASAGVVPMRGR